MSVVWRVEYYPAETFLTSYAYVGSHKHHDIDFRCLYHNPGTSLYLLQPGYKVSV